MGNTETNHLKRLAIITTHPIQYNAPLFKLLAERSNIELKVFYTWGEEVLKDKFDPGFGKAIQWDIPLLDGYDYHFVKNISKNPGSHHFNGIDNPSLINEIGEYDPTALLVFGWSFKSHLKVLRHFYGKKKILFRGDSTLLNEREGFSPKKWARSIFLKWVYRHMDTALYVGSNNKNYYKKFGVREDQLVFAPHAVENERFERNLASNFRDRLGIADDDLVFLFAGKFESVKNPGLLVQAFLEANLPGVHLLMVGNGHLESSLKEICKKEDNERIHFMDFQNQSSMPGIYQLADVFVLPSVSETWGLSVNEAMAAGVAVLVSSQCGCAPDLIREGKNGYVFSNNVPQDLVQKIKILAQDRARLKKMGATSQRSIKGWTFEKIALAIEDGI